MPKMRNISDFRQAIVINGSKKLMRPGDVIEVDRELKYIFLEPVPEDTPVTVGVASTSYSRLKTELEQLKTDKENLSAVKNEEVEENLGAIQAAMNDLRQDVDDKVNEFSEGINSDISEINDNLKALKTIFEGFKESRNNKDIEQDDRFDKMMRRLEMLKSAVMTIEDAVYGEDEGN